MLAFGVKEFVQLIESDPASAPTQSLNVAFKRLSVFAYGPTRQTVPNFLTSLTSPGAS
ncbi:hypothetical protein H110_07831 [Trichophyton rubrum MR1448]|nr:hypothetical protein H110_07831 [Trichophyton rubrum MR1448]